jgi:hypothetical protein
MPSKKGITASFKIQGRERTTRSKRHERSQDEAREASRRECTFWYMTDCESEAQQSHGKRSSFVALIGIPALRKRPGDREGNRRRARKSVGSFFKKITKTQTASSQRQDRKQRLEI